MATSASDRPRLPAAMRSGSTVRIKSNSTRALAPPPPGEMLNPAFPNVPQPAKTNWCWAAVSVAVRQYLNGNTPTMCVLINQVRPGFNCCNNPYSGPCNAPTPVDQGLKALGNWNGQYGPLNLGQIQQAVHATVPVVCVVSYAQGNHAVVLIGWANFSGVIKVAIMDPTAGVIGMPYTQLVSGYPAGGTWTESYPTKKGS